MRPQPTIGLTSKVLARKTGATYRQIDWWCTHGLIHPDTGNPGSGNYRRFDPDIVPLVTVLVQVSKAIAAGTQGHVSTCLLAKVRDHLYDGRVELDHGVTITWKIPA